MVELIALYGDKAWSWSMFSFWRRRRDEQQGKLLLRVQEAIQLHGSLTPEQKLRSTTRAGNFLLFIEKDYGPFSTIKDLPRILSPAAYSEITTAAAEAYKEANRSGRLEEAVGALFPFAALYGLHPTQKEPMMIMAGQLAAEICDHARHTTEHLLAE